MKRTTAFAVCLFFAGERAASASWTSEPPPAHRGFQLALRTGVAVPFGNVTSTTSMSDALSVQVPLLVDIGAKPIRHLFIGAFGGVAVGAAAGQISQVCDQLAVTCTGLGFRFGLQLQLNLRPREAINPWFGYGFGYEIGGSSGSSGRNKVTNTLRGFEYAHILAGVDLRVHDTFGVGPFVDGAIGQYTIARSESNAGGLVIQRGGEVQDSAIHVWAIAGVRAVLFP